MPRPQIQLPGVAQVQPQARPTDQFVQAKLDLPTPKPILDLSRFSHTLSGLIAQSKQDAHDRSLAQGQIDATYGTPFGSSTPNTPEMVENRKGFKAEQEAGRILPSEDPWYRIGVFTSEGRRAGLTMRAAIMSEENLRASSRIYDKDGNYIPPDQQEGADSIFQRQMQGFMNVPALQNVYGKQAAAQFVEATRADFVANVAHLRDQQTQMYQETQLADQTVEQLERIALADSDQSAEGLERSSEALGGLQDLISEFTVEWNLPNGSKVARQGFESFVDRRAQDRGPRAAVEAIGLVRRVRLGPVEVGEDNSEAGLDFRVKLDRLEDHYRNAENAEAEREERSAYLHKQSYLRRVDDGISEAFASGSPPSSVYEKLKQRIQHEVQPRFRDEALKALDQQYTDALRPMPENPQANEEMNRRLLVHTTGNIDEWIRGIAGTEVGYTQAREMRKRLQEEAAAWKDLPEVKLSADAFKAESEVFAADRSEGIQDTLRDLVNTEVASANKRIQIIANGLNEQQRTEQMGGIVEREYAKASQVLSAFKSDVKARSIEFDTKLLAANNMGRDFERDIVKARESGLLNRSEFDVAIRRNNDSADISRYTNDDRIKNVVRDLYPTAKEYGDALFGAKWNQINDAQIRASAMAREWFVTERPKYDSQGDADSAFSRYLNENIRREIGKAMEIPGADSPQTGIGTPGGPTVTQTNQADDGKSFQVALEHGSPEMLRIAAVKAYPIIGKMPDVVTEFQSSFGTKNGRIPKIRQRARDELAAGLGYGNADQVYSKRALLNAGPATASELLDGAMDFGGMKIPIAPSDVNIWTTMVFASTAQADASISSPRMVRSLAAKYGVQREDFDVWFKQQKLLLKVNGL